MVRLVVPKYRVGAVTIITDSEAGHPTPGLSAPSSGPGAAPSSGLEAAPAGGLEAAPSSGPGAAPSGGPGAAPAGERRGRLGRGSHASAPPDEPGAAPGRLLLLRQPPGRAWGLPAGLLKRHEPPAVGAARELHEESGVLLDPDDLTPATPNAVVHPQGWVDVVFHGSVPASRTALEVDGGEVLEARWFPLDALPPLTRDSALLLGLYGIVRAADRPSDEDDRAPSERTGAVDDGRA